MSPIDGKSVNEWFKSTAPAHYKETLLIFDTMQAFMMKKWPIYLISILLVQCSVDKTILPVNQPGLEVLDKFLNFEPNSQVRISSENEPGQPLWLCLSFVSKETKEPLPNQEVKLYHTSSTGEYEPADPNDESTARLNGSVWTNNKGQVFVQTILPGAYGSSPNNKHIHMTVPDAHPEGYDIHFKQYTGRMGRNFISGSDQHFLANLKQHTDSTLVTFLTIEVKRPQIQSK